MRDFVVPLLVALIGSGGMTGLLALIHAVRGHGKYRVDAVEALSETARKWVAEFEQDAVEARHELRLVRTEAHRLAEELRALRLAILHPSATLDGLRAMVRAGSADNGVVNLRRPTDGP